MAKREIVSITCDGPCDGAGEIPVDYDPTWVIARTDRKFRYVDLCPACGSALAALHEKGFTRSATTPLVATREVKAQRAEILLSGIAEQFPPQEGRSVGLTVTPTGVTPVGPALDEVSEIHDPEADLTGSPYDELPGHSQARTMRTSVMMDPDFVALDLNSEEFTIPTPSLTRQEIEAQAAAEAQERLRQQNLAFAAQQNAAMGVTTHTPFNPWGAPRRDNA